MVAWRLIGAISLAAVPAVTLAQPAAGGAAAGMALYQAKCGGCHSLDRDRIGPRHRGVVGRRVAAVPGFAYSPALRRLGGLWTAARLDRWLQGPQAVAPGTRMFLTVPDASTRQAIIAYLAANPATAAPASGD